MDTTYLIFDEVISEQPSDMWLDYLSKSKVNLVNLHASMYGLLLVHEDDESLTKDEQALLCTARDILQLYISHDDLYELMGADVGSYEYDPQSVLTYAQRIIDFYDGGSD